MEPKTAQQVISALADDFKQRNLSYSQVADRTGYSSRQAIWRIVTGNNYLTPSQAKRFSRAFGYNEAFLVSGAGELGGVFENVLLDLQSTEKIGMSGGFRLPHFDSTTQFDEMFRRFFGALIATFGVDSVRDFIAGCVRYLDMLNGKDVKANRQAKDFFAEWKDDLPQDSEDYRKFMDLQQMMLIQQLYGLYNQALLKAGSKS